jgi:nicotinamidase-related amidase
MPARTRAAETPQADTDHAPAPGKEYKMHDLNPSQTALVLIDVQNGTLAMPLAPYNARDIIARAANLAHHCAAAGVTVVLVRVHFSEGYADKPHSLIDTAMMLPQGGLPADWSAFPAEIAAIKADVVITKRQWSAFYGTELDLQLRRRGITTIILGGLMTNFGVESTARDAWQHNYSVVLAEDVSSSIGADLHQFAIANTLPRVSMVRPAAEIMAALPRA